MEGEGGDATEGEGGSGSGLLCFRRLNEGAKALALRCRLTARSNKLEWIARLY